MNQQNLDQVRELLTACARPLLITHISPDGDAVGSLLGLNWMLQAIGQKPTLSCQDPLPQRFSFLPGFDQVTADPQGSFDLQVTLDCSDPERAGKVGLYPNQDSPLINIDHHMTNLQFGTVNLVDPTAVSTTVVLNNLAHHMDIPLDERIALCFLTGMVTDTRGFRTSNVTADVLQMAVDWIEAGASLTTITQNALDRRPLNSLRVLGAALTRLESSDGLVWTTLPLSVQELVNFEKDAGTGLVNMLIGVEEASIAAVFTEQPDGLVDVGLRAMPGFDVAKIALSLGGGGHTLASGCQIPGPMEKAQQRVLALLRKELAR